METPAEVTSAELTEPPAGTARARARLAAALTREYSISEGAVILMASFLFSAMLGAVRQVLFNAQFGAGNEASAYYAAFRLPDGLFALIAGGASFGGLTGPILGTLLIAPIGHAGLLVFSALLLAGSARSGDLAAPLARPPSGGAQGRPRRCR